MRIRQQPRIGIAQHQVVLPELRVDAAELRGELVAGGKVAGQPRHLGLERGLLVVQRLGAGAQLR
jgi:hypothetical protein